MATLSVLFTGHLGTKSWEVSPLHSRMWGRLWTRGKVHLCTCTPNFSNNFKGFQTPKRPPQIQHPRKETCLEACLGVSAGLFPGPPSDRNSVGIMQTCLSPQGQHMGGDGAAATLWEKQRGGVLQGGHRCGGSQTDQGGSGGPSPRARTVF